MNMEKQLLDMYSITSTFKFTMILRHTVYSVQFLKIQETMSQ